MISLQNIAVTFNAGTPIENTVLQDFDLQIAQGDFITLIGGNGAGKSTLINLLAGECQPKAGQIMFDGVNITKLPPVKRAAMVARVFQDPRSGVCEEFTLEENLSIAASRGAKRGLSLALHKKNRKNMRALLADLELGLEDRLTDQVGLLSGGQRQALSLIMATMTTPKLLLLDEPTAALDPKMEKVILALIERIVTEHQLTAIMVTHCMQQAIHMGNRTLFMQHGKISKDLSGAARQGLQPADLLEYFL